MSVADGAMCTETQAKKVAICVINIGECRSIIDNLGMYAYVGHGGSSGLQSWEGGIY